MGYQSIAGNRGAAVRTASVVAHFGLSFFRVFVMGISVDCRNHGPISRRAVGRFPPA
jgi:hypothetical protein